MSCPLTLIFVGEGTLTHMASVFFKLILKLTWLLNMLSRSVFSWVCCRVWDNRAKSSAKSRSSSTVKGVHLMPLRWSSIVGQRTQSIGLGLGFPCPLGLLPCRGWVACASQRLPAGVFTPLVGPPKPKRSRSKVQTQSIRVNCEHTLSYNNGVLSQTEPKSGSVKARQLIYRYSTNTIKLRVKKKKNPDMDRKTVPRPFRHGG